jgi:hypothetical protein
MLVYTVYATFSCFVCFFLRKKKKESSTFFFHVSFFFLCLLSSSFHPFFFYAEIRSISVCILGINSDILKGLVTTSSYT